MKLTINNQMVMASEGDTIYIAAKRSGSLSAAFASRIISLPSVLPPLSLRNRWAVRHSRFLHHSGSGCMVVRTESDRLVRHRRNIIELYLSEQPDGIQMPEALKRLAFTCDVRTIRYRQCARRVDYRDESNPFFTFDNAICISCARCVRACNEIQGTFALTMIGPRVSHETGCRLAPAGGKPRGFATSNCVSCGACVKECPTGALTEKTVLEQGDRPERCAPPVPIAAWAVRSTPVCGMVEVVDDASRRWAFESGPCLYEGTVRLDLSRCAGSAASSSATARQRLGRDFLGRGLGSGRAGVRSRSRTRMVPMPSRPFHPVGARTKSIIFSPSSCVA